MAGSVQLLANTVQLPTLHQLRVNNQHRTADQISATLSVIGCTQTALEPKYPIKVLTPLNIA